MSCLLLPSRATAETPVKPSFVQDEGVVVREAGEGAVDAHQVRPCHRVHLS